MRRPLIRWAAVGALIALFLAWHVGSPWWSLSRMRAAARAGDWATVASYMDVEAVRKARMANADLALRNALARARAEQTPQAFARLAEEVEIWKQARRVTDRELVQEAEETIAFRPEDLIGGSLGLTPRIRRTWSGDLVIRHAATPSPGTFVFRRHGLGWRLDAMQWGWPEGVERP
jgi:hypothetical protein